MKLTENEEESAAQYVPLKWKGKSINPSSGLSDDETEDSYGNSNIY
jgi:hypothetical protein